MFQSDTMADKAGAILFAKTEQRWTAILAERGIEDPRQLRKHWGFSLRSAQCSRLLPLIGQFLFGIKKIKLLKQRG
jgi:hypothetical protein